MASDKKIGLRELGRLLKAPPPQGRPAGVDDILDAITSQMILLFLCVYPVVIAFHIYRIITTGWRNHFIFHVSLFFIALLLHLFRDRLDYRVRGTVILLAGVLSNIWGIYNWGLLGSGILTLAIISVFASLLLGTRGGLIVLVITTLIIAVMGYLIVSGRIVFPYDFGIMAISSTSWIVNVSGYFVLVSMLVICIGIVYNYLIDLIESLDQRASELEQSIEERDQLEKQLLQAQKMEAVGRLAGGVAHDFNNQLMVIQVSGEMLAKKIGPDGPGAQEAEFILRAGEKSASLVRQLLAFSRKQIVNPQNIDLNEVVRDLSKMLERLLGEGIKFRTRLDAEPGLIRIDPVQLDQVLMNLAVNARDAMPGGGRLAIETSAIKIEEDYASMYPDMEPGNYVIMMISDTGVGMDRHTLELIFEPFFTTKGKEKGTGLGLSTVYGIVKQSGGHITAYSEPGIGTTFKLYFQAIDTETFQKPEKRDLTKSLAGQGETIVVVEDDEEVLLTICSVLSDNGYRVMRFSSGREALKGIEEHEGRIDLLLTDVIMPEMNGRELSEKLLASHPGIKVIFISGYDDQVIAHHGIIDPSIEYIQKPFNHVTLLEKINKTLRGENSV